MTDVTKDRGKIALVDPLKLFPEGYPKLRTCSCSALASGRLLCKLKDLRLDPSNKYINSADMHKRV